MRVGVLMSTYNGELFVEEQVFSILRQLPSDGQLIVRDDGSTDNTVKKLQSIRDSKLIIRAGNNLGFAASFLTLLQELPTDIEMAMFSDQDDIWLDGKIDRAWNALSNVIGKPALYCCAQILVDEKLNEIERTSIPTRFHPSFRFALVENIVTGCTAAMNRRAIQLISAGGAPGEVRFHDWWVYLVISAFGAVIIDQEPMILYRQHGSNQIGRGAGWLGRNIKIIRFLLKHDWVQILLCQVNALNRIYGSILTPDQAALLQRYFALDNGQARVKAELIFSALRWRSTIPNDVFFRLLLLMNKSGLWPIRRSGS